MEGVRVIRHRIFFAQTLTFLNICTRSEKYQCLGNVKVWADLSEKHVDTQSEDDPDGQDMGSYADLRALPVNAVRADASVCNREAV